MKRIIAGMLSVILLVVLCLSGPILLRAEEAGLLSDFENEEYNGFLWNTDHGMLGNASTPASVQEEDNGNHYLYMPSGDKNYARYYKDAPVQAGKTYRLSLRYKGSGFAMQILGATEGGEMVRADAATEWTDYTRVFTLSDPLTASVSYILAFWNYAGDGGACIDDVYLNEVISAQSITFAQGDQLTLSTGATKQLTVVAKPNGAAFSGTVTYTSDNTAVATVSADGLVTAVKSGVANITATVNGLTATCKVTVATLLSDFENEVYNGFWWNDGYGMLGNDSTPASVEQEANGNHYLYMPSGDKNYARYYKDAPVKAGKTYRLSLRYKGTGFAMQFLGASEGGEMVRPAATTEWTEYTRVFTMNDPMTAGVSYVLAFWNYAGNGGACIDDVYLTEVKVENATGITFAEGEQLTLSKDATKQLTVIAKDGGKLDGVVTYTSDNPAVATVSADGLITAKKLGVANITATVNDLSVTCAVTVELFAPVLLGDFEGELSSGWTWNNATYGILNSSSPMSVVEDGNTGNHCLKIPPHSSGAYGRNYYGAPLEAGKMYRITLKHKGSSGQLWLMANGVESGSGYHNLPTSNEWATFSYIFTTKTPANANFSIAFRHSGGSGTAYIDDVYLTEVIAPNGIAFEEGKQLTLSKGEKHKLMVVAKPEGAIFSDKIAYKSDNTDAVTVSEDGMLTAVAPGVANIVATMKDFSTLCTVTVDPYAPILLGDFEGELSAGWTWNNTTYGILNSSSPMSVVEDGNTGNHCLKIPQHSSGAYGRNYYGAPLEAGKTYRITLKHKGSSGQLWLMANGVDAGNGLHNLPASEKWKTFSYVFTAKTPANANFSIAFRHSGSAGTAYIDDVYINEITAFDEQIFDGDFETEVLSNQWTEYVSNDKTAVVKDVASGGSCLQVSGEALPYITDLTEMIANKSYKFSFKMRGQGKAVLHMPNTVPNSQKVIGVSDQAYSVSGEYVYITAQNDTEWTECAVTFQTNNTVANAYTIGFGGGNDAVIYYDDVSLVMLGSAYVQSGLVGGEVTIATAHGEQGAILSGLHDGQTAATVKVTVMPNKGYLLVPGTLRYVTSGGITKRILNKDGDELGTGAGNVFAFDVPNENVRIVADFVRTLDDNFAFGAVGTAIHTNANGEKDGIRFLNRIQLIEFDETLDEYTLTYQGEQYVVNAFGMLLKSADVHYSLDLETYDQVTHDAGGTVKMWNVESYSQKTNVMTLVDYTDTYIDSCIAFVTDQPDEDFCKQQYTARSYIVLEKDGVKTVLYSNERTDSVNTVVERQEGKRSDDVTVDIDSVGAADPSTPIPADNLANADLKILNIGNSWGHNATSYLADVAAASGKTVKAVNLFKSGCSLETHWKGYEENLPQYWYELNGYVYWDSAVTLNAVLESDDWDIIVTHASPSEGAKNTYEEYLKKLKTAVKKHCPDAEVYLMQTWAFGDDYAYLTTETGLSRAEMWEKVESISKTASAAADVKLIPCGEAAYELESWFEENAPTLSFYQADDSHAADTWGWYMLALVWYQTLTGEVPSNTFVDFDSDYTNDPVVRAKVHEIAQTVVTAYAN